WRPSSARGWRPTTRLPRPPTRLPMPTTRSAGPHSAPRGPAAPFSSAHHPASASLATRRLLVGLQRRRAYRTPRFGTPASPTANDKHVHRRQDCVMSDEERYAENVNFERHHSGHGIDIGGPARCDGARNDGGSGVDNARGRTGRAGTLFQGVLFYRSVR